MVNTKEENVAIFRRYIAEISCVGGYHDISWRNIGPAVFRHLSREIGDFSPIYRVVNAGQRKSNPLQCPSTRYSASHFACCWEDLNPKPKGLGCTRLPPGLSSPLINNMQQLYIYLNSLYKENIRIF